MNRSLSMSAIAIAIASASSVAIGAEVELDNPEAKAASGDKMSDAQTIASVLVRGADGRLVVESRTLGPAYIEVAGETAIVTGPLFALAIDTDADAATGGSPSYVPDVEGAEWQVAVDVCAYGKDQPQPAAQHCVHGLRGQDLGGGAARVTLRDLATPDHEEETMDAVAMAAPGREIHFEIPYDRLGAKPGDTLRIHALGSRANGVFGVIAPALELTLD